MTSFLNPAAGSGYLGRYNKMANMKTNFLTKTAWDQHIVGMSVKRRVVVTHWTHFKSDILR